MSTPEGQRARRLHAARDPAGGAYTAARLAKNKKKKKKLKGKKQENKKKKGRP